MEPCDVFKISSGHVLIRMDINDGAGNKIPVDGIPCLHCDTGQIGAGFPNATGEVIGHIDSNGTVLLNSNPNSNQLSFTKKISERFSACLLKKIWFKKERSTERNCEANESKI